ncbi:hypothetical protein L6452_37823 [Arctium lappa]|uniref:Uncharacterized protein n=1 Tax=Arctium lappa TaxID=4217 RepID=A0ACB8Y416_ARCLA|nr:hypothetical protein L6452_37823 [Arctium lappa]
MKAHEQKHRDKESQVSTASGENSDNLFRSPEKIEKMKLPVSKQAQGKNKITFYFCQHTPSTNSNHTPNNAKEKSSPKKVSVEPLEIEHFQTKGVVCTPTTLDVTLIGHNSITKDTKDKFDETQDQKYKANKNPLLPEYPYTSPHKSQTTNLSLSPNTSNQNREDPLFSQRPSPKNPPHVHEISPSPIFVDPTVPHANPNATNIMHETFFSPFIRGQKIGNPSTHYQPYPSTITHANPDLKHPHAIPNSKNPMHRSGTPHLIGARSLSQVSNDNVETHSRKRISIKDKARKSMGKKHKVEERSETEQCLDKIDVSETLTKETIASSLPEAGPVIWVCLEK